MSPLSSLTGGRRGGCGTPLRDQAFAADVMALRHSTSPKAWDTWFKSTSYWQRYPRDPAGGDLPRVFKNTGQGHAEPGEERNVAQIDDLKASIEKCVSGDAQLTSEIVSDLTKPIDDLTDLDTVRPLNAPNYRTLISSESDSAVLAPLRLPSLRQLQAPRSGTAYRPSQASSS